VGRGGVFAAAVADVGRVMVARGTVDMAYRQEEKIKLNHT